MDAGKNGSQYNDVSFLNLRYLAYLYFSPQGRINRKKYIAGNVFLTLLSIVIAIIGWKLLKNPQGEVAFDQLIIGLIILIIPVIIMSVMVAIKRFHDRGHHGAWVISTFIPYLGLLPLLYLLVAPGKKEDNAYGANPCDTDDIIEEKVKAQSSPANEQATPEPIQQATETNTPSADGQTNQQPTQPPAPTEQPVQENKLQTNPQPTEQMVAEPAPAQQPAVENTATPAPIQKSPQENNLQANPQATEQAIVEPAPARQPTVEATPPAAEQTTIENAVTSEQPPAQQPANSQPLAPNINHEQNLTPPSQANPNNETSEQPPTASGEQPSPKDK